jgi:transcriptional regulator GlxA family with amidase domain
MIPKRIGIIGFDGVVAIDLAGPADAFTYAEIPGGQNGPRRCYEVVTIGLSDRPFVSESGVVFKPQKSFKNAPPLDTLIVPGGSGVVRKPQIAKAIAAFVKARAKSTRRLVSICTGVYGLAEAGLLNGRKVATHWAHAGKLSHRFPELQVDDNAIFVKDGSFYTSAGATAGIDLSLSLIEEDYGPRVAMAVARDLVVYLKRPGGQEQYSEPLRFQTQSVSRISDLATWIVSHLRENLSVEALAAKACLCPRHFCRRFKSEFGHSPAEFVERLRLDEARHRLSTGDNSIENVGLSVGFKSADAFRRAFERRLEITPRDYRRRFSTAVKTEGDSHRRPKLNKVLMAA